jgi:hypothetical protein
LEFCREEEEGIEKESAPADAGRRIVSPLISIVARVIMSQFADWLLFFPRI